MPGVINVAGWTIDFRSGVAYIRLSCGKVALRTDKNGAMGIIEMIKIPLHVRERIKYPESWERLEEVPFVEFFGKKKMIIR